MCSINTAMKQRLDELEEFLDEHQEPVTDYDEGMVRRSFGGVFFLRFGDWNFQKTGVIII